MAKKKKGMLQKIKEALVAPGKLPPPPKPLPPLVKPIAPPPGLKKVEKPVVKKKKIRKRKKVKVTKPVTNPVTKPVTVPVTVPVTIPATEYPPDPTVRIREYMQEEAWLAEMNRNRPAINRLWNRWEGRNISERDLKLLISGAAGSAPVYGRYERYREYAVFDPLATEYYGRSLRAGEMEKVVKKFGSYDMFSSFVDFHRRANSVWLNSPYGRAIVPNELTMLMRGQLPPLPKIEWKVYA